MVASLETFKHTAKRLIKCAWKIYQFIAILFLTLFCMIMVLVTLRERFDYIELPNGMLLKKLAWLDSDIALTTHDGNIIAHINAGSIQWTKNYVAGYTTEYNENSKTGLIDFVYKIGEKRAIFSNQNYEEYLGKKEAMKLDKINGFSGEDKNFWDLSAIPEMRRSFFYPLTH